MTRLTERYDSGEYLATTPDWHAYDSPWKAQKIYDLLKAQGVAPRTVCDVGCGAGEVLVELQKRMVPETKFVGFDTSSMAIGLCQPKANASLEFHNKDFLAADDRRYDVVLLLDVFEHVPDYLGFLTKIAERADRVVFHIPLDINATAVLLGSSYMMYMRREYGHLHYFTAETALATLEESGYRIVHYHYTWDKERDVYPRMPKSILGKIQRLIEWGILTVERFGNRISPALWARFRKEYNLLVLAEPIRKPQP